MIYIKAKTNLPYLIKTDGTFKRHETSGKPLVYDENEKKVKEFDDQCDLSTELAWRWAMTPGITYMRLLDRLPNLEQQA